MKSILLFCCLLGTLPCPILAETHTASPSALMHSTQLIVVITSDWNAVDGRLQLYQRPAPGNSWSAVGDAVAVVVGKKGMGWGIGMAPITAAPSADDPVKQEGDSKAPAGIFRLGSAFGYAPDEPGGWKMPYLALTSSIDCVDDSHSRFYNRVLDRSTVSPDWNTAEHMRAAGEAYRWGVIINQNSSSPRPEGGSCVFMHIWSGPGSGTAGCTAMPEQQIKSILAWLDPAAEPLLVQMPLREYQKMRKSLHLPAPPSAPRP